MAIFKIPIDVEGVLCYNNFRSKWYKGLRHLFHTILYRGGIMLLGKYVHECPTCKRKFRTNNPAMKYCSSECRIEALRTLSRKPRAARKWREDPKVREYRDKRRKTIADLMDKTGITNYAEVAYYYDMGLVDKLLAIAERRKKDGLIKVSDVKEKRIVRPHGAQCQYFNLLE